MLSERTCGSLHYSAILQFPASALGLLYSSRMIIDGLGGRLEDLEFECQQGVELGLMAAAGIGQTIADRLFERPKLRIIPPMEAVGLYQLPEPCDEVEVGGIRRQPEPGHREACRLGHHIGIALIYSPRLSFDGFLHP